MESLLEQWRRERDAYKVERDNFIRENLPDVKSELTKAVVAAIQDNESEVIITRDCSKEGYPLFRDLFYAVRDQVTELGWQAELIIRDDHKFRPEGTIQPTQFWFDLAVSLEPPEPVEA